MLLDDITMVIETKETIIGVDEHVDANLILDLTPEIFVSIDSIIPICNVTIDTSEIKLRVEDLPDVSLNLDVSHDVIILAAGNIGTKGDTGDIGPVGPQGNTGSQGNPGPQGIKGDVGPPGSQGNTGSQGNPGPQGNKGDTGATGAGVPAGGTAGQLLTKISSVDFESAWQVAPETGADLVYNGQFPTGGPNYTDGDIVIGDDGVLYICVAPTTSPPTAWPGGGVYGAKTFIFVQGSPSATWIIPHNMDKYPSIEVVDTGDSVVIPTVHYDSSNQITATFGSATSGKAYLN